MLRISDNIFLIGTPHTTYMFKVTPKGHLEHLYYGESLGDISAFTKTEINEAALALTEKRAFAAGNMISYDQEDTTVTLEDTRLEFSTTGKGDIRDPFAEIVHADGSRTLDLIFEKAEIRRGKEPLKELPSSYAGIRADGEQAAETLVITLKDISYGETLELLYTVFDDSDVIARSSRLINTGKDAFTILRLMSFQLDTERDDLCLTTFSGAWAREMQRETLPIRGARLVNTTAAGISSNRHNPFVMLHEENTTETSGECIGINLIYSGDHYSSAEVNAYGKTHIISGMAPQGFSWLLGPGESFEAPECIFTYSASGFDGMSRSLHDFVREHIVRGCWQHRERPVLLNSWEAGYFNINEKKLVRMAKEARDLGAELFVMDDGWFKGRNTDTSSLGDWDPDPTKLPSGLKGLAEKIRECGISFGIWIEPEMVNTDSDLYRAHPDWALEIPGRPHSEGRNQRILDLANPEVVDYLIGKLRTLLASADISYVKWDMNRIMSDVYSPCLPAERQGETAHRYILGFYRMAKALTEAFPRILFEGCASGGCRFDLGALCYFPQIWASDDTDPIERVRIQEGYSYAYPLSCLGAHVSASPNHQTLRRTPLNTRFNVAAFGVLGYELDPADLDRNEKNEIREQIALYKEWRHVFQFGSFHRVQSGNIHEWTCASENGQEAVGFMLIEKGIPNRPFAQFKAAGLEPSRLYHFRNKELRQSILNFGSLINTASPVHIRQDSLVHQTAARFVTMPGETEDYRVSGALLMKAGLKLKSAYTGTGYDENVRLFSDAASRLYFMEAESDIIGEAAEEQKKGKDD